MIHINYSSQTKSISTDENNKRKSRDLFKRKDRFLLILINFQYKFIIKLIYFKLLIIINDLYYNL